MSSRSPTLSRVKTGTSSRSGQQRNSVTGLNAEGRKLDIGKKVSDAYDAVIQNIMRDNNDGADVAAKIAVVISNDKNTGDGGTVDE